MATGKKKNVSQGLGRRGEAEGAFPFCRPAFFFFQWAARLSHPPRSLLSLPQFKIEPFKHPVTMDPSYGGACAACVGRGRRGAGGAGAGKNGAGGESLGALGRSSPLSLTHPAVSLFSLF